MEKTGVVHTILQTAALGVALSPPGQSLQSSCAAEPISVVMVILTVMSLASTADKLMPKVTKTPRSNATICLTDQLFMAMRTMSANYAENKPE